MRYHFLSHKYFQQNQAQSFDYRSDHMVLGPTLRKENVSASNGLMRTIHIYEHYSIDTKSLNKLLFNNPTKI